MSPDNRPSAFKNAAPGAVVAAELETQQALALRAKNFTYAQIATELGCSKAWAYRLVHRGWQRLIEDNDEIRGVLRAIELEELDKLMEAVMPIATADVGTLAALDAEAQVMAGENQLKAVGAAIKIIQTRARMLGLNAPAKIEHSSKSNLMPLDQLRVLVQEHEARRPKPVTGRTLTLNP